MVGTPIVACAGDDDLVPVENLAQVIDAYLRARYPNRYRNRNQKKCVESFQQGRPLANEGTDALPGTEEKIQVMEERWARGQQIHHPDDVRLVLPKGRRTSFGHLYKGGPRVRETRGSDL